MFTPSLKRSAWLAPVAAAFLLIGCFESPSGGSDDANDTTIVAPPYYVFIGPDTLSSVDNGAATVRNLLIQDLQSAARVAAGGGFAGTSLAATEITKYYNHVDADSLNIRTTMVAGKTPLHTKYAQIAANASLADKASSAVVIGYGVSADSLLRMWVGQVVANALDSAKRKTALAYFDANGVDLSQMISKIQAGAVSFHQGTTILKNIDTYDNTVLVSGKNYTAREHAWDEAFGYFGAARNYTAYTDDSLNAGANSYRDDFPADGKVDWRAENNFNMMARYTARRDRTLAQNWNGDIFAAFIKGRALISAKRNASTLASSRATIARIWEEAFAANTISYIKNVSIILDTISDTPTVNARGTLAGNFSEMKAFAVCLQFNALDRKITDTQLAQLQGYLGTYPDRSVSGKAAYRLKLDSAKALVKSVYGFSDAQVNADAWK